MSKESTTDCECRECGWRWKSRKKGELPLKCPNPLCQSAFWNGKPVYGTRSENQREAAKRGK